MSTQENFSPVEKDKPTPVESNSKDSNPPSNEEYSNSADNNQTTNQDNNQDNDLDKREKDTNNTDNITTTSNDNDNYNSFLQSLSQQQKDMNAKAMDDAKNIDLLLQQYGGDFNQSATTQLQHHQPATQSELQPEHSPSMDNSNNTTSNRVCARCMQNNWKCQWIADLGKCAQCEGKKWKCEIITNNNNVSKPSRSNTPVNVPNSNVNPQQGMKRDYSMNSNGENNKRRKNSLRNQTAMAESNPSLTNNNAVYSNFITSLYNSMSPGTGPNNSNGNNNSTTNLPSNHSNNNMNNLRNMQSPAQTALQYPRSSFYVGPTSVYDISIINSIATDNMDQIQISSSSSLRKVSSNVQFLLRDDHDQNMYIRQEQEVDMVERLIYPHGRILVDIFFKLIHPFFPILHERVFLEKYARSYRELTAPLLASIYSLALQWWDFHPKLIGFNKPDSSVITKLNDLAFTTFFHRIDRPKLSMIQTGLLILQCRMNQPDNWVICSNLVALAEELGLGVDCQDWKLPKWEKDLRKRLAWAVWSQDKWIALIEGRHSHLILGRNWLVKLLKRDDFPQNSPTIELQNNSNNNSNSNISGNPNNIPGSMGGMDPQSGKLDMDPMNPMFSSMMMMDSLALIDMNLTKEDFNNGTLMFQQMVSLSIIVGEIMDTFYTQGAIHVNTSIEQVLKLAKPLQLKLREWYHSLPPQLSMGKFVPRKFNSNASLTLSYFAAEITLHRKIISTLHQNYETSLKELVQVCRMAAKTRLIAAIEFVRDLKNEHINSFWYSNSTGNFMLIGTFAAMLYVTSQVKEEAVVFRDLMRNYIWILRVGSKSFDKLKVVLDNMHQLLAQVPGLLTDEAPVKEFVPPPLSTPGNGFKPSSSSSSVNVAQQQIFKQYPHSQVPSQQMTSASPAITEQGSASPLVLQNNPISQNNNNNNITNNSSALPNKNSTDIISPDELVHSVMTSSPHNKANVVSTPRSAGRTPVFLNSNLTNEVNNNSNTSSTPGDYKTHFQQQCSPSLQSQISETYSVGQIGNPSETPRNDPIPNIPESLSSLNTNSSVTATGTINPSGLNN
ncbi:Fungal specific transcription factor [Monosporozyma unispora]|nr:Fungal specific transcription factor [Kazachstania unispora]